MQPGRYDISARQNIDLRLPLGMTESPSGLPIPVTGWTFLMQIRREAGEPGDPLIEISSEGSSGGDGIIVTNAAGGTFEIRITWETLGAEEIPAGRLAYDLIIDKPDGERAGVIFGDFIAKPGVTVE